MSQKRKEPDFPEPPVKRLRQTKSRMDYYMRHGSQVSSVVSSHLLSPEVTGSSSDKNNHTSPPEITQPDNGKTRPQISARPSNEHALSTNTATEPKKEPADIAKREPAPKTASKEAPEATTKVVRRSDTHDKVQKQARSTRNGKKAPKPPAEDEGPDPAVLKAQITQYFTNKAAAVYKHAAHSLGKAHKTLIEALDNPQNEDKKLFRSKIKTLSRPVNGLKIRYRVQKSDGTETREEAVGELVSRADKQQKEFLGKFDSLWKEWNDLQLEIKEVAHGKGIEGSSAMEDDEKGQEQIEKKVLEKEIAEAEKEIECIMEVGLELAKEIEREHRKATLPHLHRYYRSINMF
ncbi:hypothetical protein QBC43DRAFT_290708 [Cladorrhinum sp. PSN259]|nr:hypothetical protein QBC43DRAFT_290708 [Cladorrhinum sp. PSN259]